MKVDELSVFFPAYNEEGNIRKTVENAVRVLESLKLKKYEVLVVDDGSVDKTAEVVSTLTKSNPRIHLISHEQNKGYGGALKTGFGQSKYNWVAFTDSDGQFDFGEITKMLEKTSDYDLVLGYRLNRADPFIRSVTTFGWKTIAMILMGLSVKDYSCGFKLMRKKVYDSVLPLEGEEKVTQIEMLVKAKRQGFKITEVGLHHYPRQFGKQTGANLKVVFKSIFDLFSLWWKIR